MAGFIDIPREQTTAFTDLILAVTATIATIIIFKTGRLHDRKKAGIWSWVFGLLTVASAFGAVAHGFKMSTQFNGLLWQPLNLSLGLMIALIVAGVIYDLRAGHLPRFLLLILLFIGLVFYTITLMIPGKFLVFILYEALAMLFAMVSYLVLALRSRLKGAWFMFGGIVITIIASVIQSVESIRFDLIWEFDHNGIFHLVQVGGLVFLVLGLRAEILTRAKV